MAKIIEMVAAKTAATERQMWEEILRSADITDQILAPWTDSVNKTP
jgi:hypothetical protein